MSVRRSKAMNRASIRQHPHGSQITSGWSVGRSVGQVGPTQYRSQSILETCSPEIMRDFFWDDEFRISSRWDEMLVTSSVVEEWPETGVQVVQWLRKVGGLG